MSERESDNGPESQHESEAEGESDSGRASETETTGLPWPMTWTGAYFFVIGSFILWLILLIALTECYA